MNSEHGAHNVCAVCFIHGAVPYLDAMSGLNKITDNYGYDSADAIVRYFLSNATTWRGPDARRVKAELKGML